MENYQPNSHASKENVQASVQDKNQKIITGTASIQKKSGFKKFVGEFVTTQGSDLKDVFVSSIKNSLLDFLTAALGGKPRRGGTTIADKVSYYSIYDRDRTARNRDVPPARSTVYDYDNIILDTREDAEAVIDRLCELIERYGKAKVSDLYDFCSLSGEYTNEYYGWFDLRDARAIRTRDGRFMLDLPKAVAIK